MDGSAARDIAPGQMLGNCRIVEQIGQGGMGTVYKAYQLALGRYVAVKVISPSMISDPTVLARFRREAQSIAGFRHPNILTVYDFGEQNGLAYLITELATGGTLKAKLGAPLRVAESLALLRPIGLALDYAHARNVVHRDVKPANVLVHDEGTLVLSDFGLARLPEGAHSKLTVSGLLVGTPSYMAPEQGLGSQVGPSADLYALGVMAYEMLTGSVPFTGPTPVSIMLAHVQEPLPAASERNPDVPSKVEAVLERALAKQPADRFATAAEMLDALEAAGSSSSAADPTGVVDSARRIKREGSSRIGTSAQVARRRRVAVVAGALGIALLLLLATTAVLTQTTIVGLQPTPEPVASWQVLTAGRADTATSGFPALAIDRLGFLYVAIDDQRIQKLSPNGQPVAGPWGTKGGPVEFDQARGIAVDATGSIYVTESGTAGRVQKLAVTPPDWLQPVAQWAAAGSAPVGVAVDQDGNVYVAERGNNRVQKRWAQGAAVTQWGTTGSAAGQFNAPMGLALDSQGNLYVADSGNNRLQKLSATGAALAQWGKSGGGPGEFVAPQGVAVDKDGNIYVADTGNSRIQKLSPDGKSLAQWGTPGSGVGEFDHPSGVAVDAAGDVYVTDSGNHRIQKLGLARS